jgi:hypothetical protein
MSSNTRNRRRVVGAAFAGALAFSAATAHADPNYPVPIGDQSNYTDCCVAGPWQALEDQYYQDFSAPNDPAETFDGLVRLDSPFWGFSGIRNDYNVYVEKDISGNVSVGEQYNELNFGGPGSAGLENFHLVYDNIGGTPEAAFVTPYGDLNFPTWFVELLGPSFFEPSFYTEPPLLDSPLPAAELLGLAPAAEADTDLDPFQDLFGYTGFNAWTTTADSSLVSSDPTLAASLDTSVDNFEMGFRGFFPADPFSVLVTYFDPTAFSDHPDVGGLPVNAIADLAVSLDYTLFAGGLDPVLVPGIEALFIPIELPIFLLLAT